jgi:cell division protein FtsB
VQFGENGIFALFHLQAHEARLRQEVVALEADNTELAGQIGALATDPAALEKLAREKHNMRRPDEAVLTVSTPRAAD